MTAKYRGLKGLEALQRCFEDYELELKSNDKAGRTIMSTKTAAGICKTMALTVAELRRIVPTD